MIREAKTNKHRLKSWHTKKPAPTNSAENILSIPDFKLWQQTGSTELGCPRENSWFDLKISGCQKQTWETWNPKQRELVTSAPTSDRRSLIFPLLLVILPLSLLLAEPSPPLLVNHHLAGAFAPPSFPKPHTLHPTQNTPSSAPLFSRPPPLLCSWVNPIGSSQQQPLTNLPLISPRMYFFHVD